jgi:hypothetical protein
MPRPMRPLFTQRWQDGLAPAMRSAMTATLRLFRVGTPVYIPETNSYTDASVALYGGTEGAPGRVQPLRSSRFEPAPMDASYWQTVLISVPIQDVQAVDFRPGDQARVLESPLNFAIEDYQYVVTEIIDSSNPLERTLLCSVSLEVAVN